MTDPSERVVDETPNYPTRVFPTFGGSKKGSLRRSHPAVPSFYPAPLFHQLGPYRQNHSTIPA